MRAETAADEEVDRGEEASSEREQIADPGAEREIARTDEDSAEERDGDSECDRSTDSFAEEERAPDRDKQRVSADEQHRAGDGREPERRDPEDEVGRESRAAQDSENEIPAPDRSQRASRRREGTRTTEARTSRQAATASGDTPTASRTRTPPDDTAATPSAILAAERDAVLHGLRRDAADRAIARRIAGRARRAAAAPASIPQPTRV